MIYHSSRQSSLLLSTPASIGRNLSAEKVSLHFLFGYHGVMTSRTEDKNRPFPAVEAVFFDVDGTLYDHAAGGIPDLHMKAMKDLQGQGIKVCLCSGRCMPLLENLGILDLFPFDGVVAGNGSYVYGEKGRLIYADPVDPRAAADIFRLAAAQNIPVFAAGNRVLVTEMTDGVRDLFERISVQNIPVRNPLPDDTFAVLSLVEENRRLHPEFAVPGIRLLENELSMDMMKDDLSKYEGIRRLLDYYGLSSYMAFGDALNDLEMLEHADVGVAMGNAQKELLERIPEVCPPVTESGIYVWLKDHGFLSVASKEPPTGGSLQ